MWGLDALAPEPHWLRRQRHDNDNPSPVLAVPDLVFTDPERLALAGFLAGYRGLTRDAYALDLRQFVSWCERHGLKLFSVRRTDIELYARALEEAGRARATVARRLCTVAGFYRYAEEEGLVPVSPAVHVRRPRLDYESHAIGLDRNEVGALLVAAGLGRAAEHALISLLALNGLRVSEALGADIEALGLERGHRTLTVLRKGGKIVTVPLAPRTAQRGRPGHRRTPGRADLFERPWRAHRPPWCRAHRAPCCPPCRDRQADRSAHASPCLHYRLRSMRACRLRDVQEAASHADPRTTMRYDRARMSLDRHATYMVATFIAGAVGSTVGQYGRQHCQCWRPLSRFRLARDRLPFRYSGEHP